MTESSKKPTHRAFIVKSFKGKDGEEKSRWLEIGSVWTTRTAKASTFSLSAADRRADHHFALTSRSQLTPPKTTPDASPRRSNPAGLLFITKGVSAMQELTLTSTIEDIRAAYGASAKSRLARFWTFSTGSMTPRPASRGTSLKPRWTFSASISSADSEP